MEPLQRSPPLHNKDLESHRCHSPVALSGLTVNAVHSRHQSPPSPHNNGGHEKHDTVPEAQPIGHIGLVERLKHFTWNWFAASMSTGGVALILANEGWTFRGLRDIGIIVYIFNLVLTVCFITLMILRFILCGGGIVSSLTRNREGIMFPTFWLTLATLLSGLARYWGQVGAPHAWVLSAANVLFWIYAVATFSSCVLQYTAISHMHPYELSGAMPAWILPVFPPMLAGTIASVISAAQPPRTALTVVIGGLTCQGVGMLVSLMIYAIFLSRLLTAGLPDRDVRPAMFISVGPPAFTALALIGMASGVPLHKHLAPGVDGPTSGSAATTLSSTIPDLDIDAAVFRLLALAVAVFLWGLSLFWFCLSFFAVVMNPPRTFNLRWWAMVFPNAGFTLSTLSIGHTLNSGAIKGVGTGMSIVVIVAYLFVLGATVQAIITKRVLWPKEDDDSPP